MEPKGPEKYAAVAILIYKNKENLFNTNRNADFVEALMEFGAMKCKPKDPNCLTCCLNKSCKYFKSNKKVKNLRKKMVKNKDYDIFCYINKKKQIALTKKNKISFSNQTLVPIIKYNEEIVSDSWNIFVWLNDKIKGIKLIPNEQTRVFSHFLYFWTSKSLLPLIFKLIANDIPKILNEEDKEQIYYKELELLSNKTKYFQIRPTY